MQRALLLLGVLAMAVSLFSGCEPTLSEEELGHIVFEVPKVEPAENPDEFSHEKAASAEGQNEPAASHDSHSHSGHDHAH
ncbi:MAG: hypothetical protein HUU20_24140 [Pirellulales bacterium]|nr:hypothetical protein [Pirellulales bacterium]